MKRIALLLALLLFPLTLAAADATTVILVRHAEAESGSQDPALTEAGQARAKALADAVREANVSAAIVTQYKRTKDTAAGAVKVPQIEMPVDRAKIGEHLDAIAKRIIEEHRGQTVLVVGHSNTIPLLVRTLTGIAVPDIPHEEYSRIYVVVIEGGKARMIVSRYGA